MNGALLPAAEPALFDAANAAVDADPMPVSSIVPQTQPPVALKPDVVLAVAVVAFCTETIVCKELPKKLAPALFELQKMFLPTSLAELKVIPVQVNCACPPVKVQATELVA